MIRRPPAELRLLRRRLRGRPDRPRRPAPTRDTSIERAVAAWLDELGVPYRAQEPLTPGFRVDFFVPTARLAVECHGTYFHADARHHDAALTAAQRRKRLGDAAAARQMATVGWRRLVLWEEDIRHRPESCRRELVEALGEEATMAEERISLTTPTGVTITVCHGDLTLEAVDVIVNAANGRLAHGGGVAAAVVRRGGAAIQDESDAWVRAHGEVPTGGVALTGAGTLACRAVIHAVGPVWHGGADGEAGLLAAAVRRALELGAAEGFESIALPAISSGIFGFPKDRCAAVLVEEALRFAAAPGSLRRIRLCNFDAPTVDVFEAELRRRGGR